MKKVLMLILVLGLLGTASADFQDGLIAYWDFENGSFQSQVAGSPNCTMGGDPEFVEGKAGKAMHFDGDGDIVYMDFGTGSYVDTCDDGMTVMAWVKTDRDTGWNGYVSRDGEDGRGWQIRQRGGGDNARACLTTRDAGSSNGDGSPSSMMINDGQWRLIAATFDPNDTKKLYINGVLDQTDTATNPIPPSAASLALGGRQRNDGALDGYSYVTLDDVAVWDRVLTAEELASLYHVAIAGRPLSEANTWFPSLVSPADGTPGILEAGTLLKWAAPAETPPAPIAKYDVYLSRNEPNATMNEFIGSVDAGQTLEIDSGALLADSTYYWVVDAVIDSSSKALSTAWSFQTVLKVPSITKQPVSVTVMPGKTVVFSVEAIDAESYQWYSSGGAIIGATSSELEFINVGSAYANDYYCIVTNANGDRVSNTASLVIINMIGHWTFDEGAGSVAYDTSDKGPVADAVMYINDGGVEHPDPNAHWSPDGMIGACYDGFGGSWFDTGLSSVQLGLDGNSSKTVSCWVYPRDMNDGGIWDVGERADSKNWSLRTESESGGDHGWRVQYWGGDYNFNTFTGMGMRNGYRMPSLNSWIHFVVTHDGAKTKVYGNGLLIVDWDRVIDTGQVISFRIGAYGDGDGNIEVGFDGLIDDVRLYDNALSHEDVAELYTAVMPDVPICVDEVNPAMDLNGDCIVDVGDLFLLLSEWLECNTVPDCKP